MDRSIVLLAVGVASGGLTGSSLVVVTFVASWVALTVGFALGRRMAPPPEERGTPSDIELSLDLLDTPAWIERPDGTLAGMNPSLRQLLNHPGPFEDTASLLAAVPTASGHHVPMPPREGRFVGRPFELLDGRCAELRRTRMPDGRALWKLRDVTAERDLARAAAATFRKLNAVLDVVDQPVCVKDDAFRVLACNEAYARLVSGTRSWLVGHGPDDTGAPAALVTQREDDERALLTWMEYRTEEPTSGGEPVRTRIVPIRGAGGRPLLVRVSAWTNAVQGEDLPEEPEVTQGTWSWSIERGVLLDPCCDLLLGYRLVRAPSQLALVLRELVRSADHLPLWRAVGSLVSARASEVDALVRPRHRQDAWVRIHGRVLDWSASGWPAKVVGTITEVEELDEDEGPTVPDLPRPTPRRRVEVGGRIPEPRPRPRPSRRFAGKVLVAEDIPLNQRLIARLLGSRGIDVEVVPDGRAAVTRAGESRYDMIFMDLQMPEMDGWEATRAIRAAEGHGRRVPICAFSANVQENRERCFAEGMDDVLPKPIAQRDLDAILSRWLSRGEA